MQHPIIDNVKEKPLQCPVPHKERGKVMAWIKKIGVAGFFFFLIKGLLWLIIPYLLAKGLL
jgi:hypothetical protein